MSKQTHEYEMACGFTGLAVDVKRFNKWAAKGYRFCAVLPGDVVLFERPFEQEAPRTAAGARASVHVNGISVAFPAGNATPPQLQLATTNEPNETKT